MRTITQTSHTIPLFIDHSKGAGDRKYITYFEAVQACEKGGAVIVNEATGQPLGEASNEQQ